MTRDLILLAGTVGCCIWYGLVMDTGTRQECAAFIGAVVLGCLMGAC